MNSSPIRPPYVLLSLGSLVTALSIVALVKGPECGDCGSSFYLLAGLFLGAGIALLAAAFVRLRLQVLGRAAPPNPRLRKIVTAAWFGVSLIGIGMVGRPMTTCTGSVAGPLGSSRPGGLSCSTESIFATPGFWMLIGWGVALVGWLIWLRAQSSETFDADAPAAA